MYKKIGKNEKQRYGRNKQTIINKTYINGGEYRNKFNNISQDLRLNKLLYTLSKKILFHRTGTVYEDMYWIDPNTYKIVAQEINGRKKHSIQYSKKTKRIVRKKTGLITIHSHPSSFPPSIDDFNANYQYGYLMGIVCCHDGKIYIYNSNEEVPKEYYNIYVQKFLKKGYNEYEAQVYALNKIMENYCISYKEVF